MSSIPEIVSYLQFSRTLLLEAIEGLSERELTETPLYEGWTIKEVLAHILGWDQRTLKILPLILQNRADEVAGVEVEAHNQASIEAWRTHSVHEIVATMTAVHNQIMEIISGLDHIDIDLRHTRNGRVITIRSYIIEIMADHERQHAAEIQQWRRELEASINPTELTTTLLNYQQQFKALLDGLDEAALNQPDQIGRWSIKDVVGHVADWQDLMLRAAKHIFDPSLPKVLPVSGLDDVDDWNEVMAGRRENQPWSQIYQDLLEVQTATEKFVTQLKPSDWRLRGPYPWPNDQGSLAELISHIIEHYPDHLPEIKAWRAERGL